MASENLVLSEVEFYEFQRFCRLNGFDLCYFGPEISGSRASIESHRFGGPRVVRLKSQRFTFEGTPYDVAEWQQGEWSAALQRLRDEFFETGREAKMAEEKAKELEKAERKRKWAENWVFFRLAATSMSAGILLVLAPSAGTVLPFVGFLLLLASVLFLITEWSRFFLAKWHNSLEKILWCGEQMTPLFIMISIASVLFSGVKILVFLQSGTGNSPSPTPSWELTLYSQTFFYWIIFFVVTLAMSVFRTESAIAKTLSRKQKIKRVGLRLMLGVGVIAASILELTTSVEANGKDVLVFVIILTVLVLYWLLRDKTPSDPPEGRMGSLE